MVLGSSLAHGVAARYSREALEDFEGRLPEIESKLDALKKKRAARYRFLQNAYWYLYQAHAVAAMHEGNLNGKDKSASFIFIGLWPKKYRVNGEDKPFFELRQHTEYAKYPVGMFDGEPLVIMGKHAIARYMETYGETDLAKIFRENFVDVSALVLASIRKRNDVAKNTSKEDAIQLYGEKGVIKCLWLPSERVLEIKTIISYDAMPQAQADEYRALRDYRMVSQWRNYHK